MLGVGLEAIGYSSVRSESVAYVDTIATSVVEGDVAALYNLSVDALSFAVIDGLAQRTIGGLDTELFAVSSALFALPQVTYSSTRGEASARSLSQNFSFLRTRNAYGDGFTSAELIAFVEAIVPIINQEAIARASLLGTVDGYYGAGEANSSVLGEGIAERIRRGKSSAFSYGDAVIDVPELTTRNAFSDTRAYGIAYGEWQENNILYATGHSATSATVTSLAHLRPSIEPLTPTAQAEGAANLIFNRGSLALATAEASIADQHIIGHFGAAISVGTLDGVAYRTTFEPTVPSVVANCWLTGGAATFLVGASDTNVTADALGTAFYFVPAQGEAFSSSIFEIEGVAVRPAASIFYASAFSEGAIKVNDYWPAPIDRLLVVDGRESVVTVPALNRVLEV